MEIERKYLIINIPPEIERYPKQKIIQGYIDSSEFTEIRLRDKEGKFVQTFKKGTGEVREEVEIELTELQFKKLWPLTAGKRIEKVRYKIPFHDHLIELDIFHAELNGLVIAEVEFKSTAASGKFKQPAWFGPEVTFDERYKNKNLVTAGLPEEDN